MRKRSRTGLLVRSLPEAPRAFCFGFLAVEQFVVVDDDVGPAQEFGGDGDGARTLQVTSRAIVVRQPRSKSPHDSLKSPMPAKSFPARGLENQEVLMRQEIEFLDP